MGRLPSPIEPQTCGSAAVGQAFYKTIHGIVHGKTIELDQEVGVPDGQKVEVAIQIIGTGAETEPWGEGLRRCAGALAGIPGLDEDMKQILAERKTARFREVPE